MAFCTIIRKITRRMGSIDCVGAIDIQLKLYVIVINVEVP